MNHNGLGQRPLLPGKTLVPGQTSIYAAGPLNLTKSNELTQSNDFLDTFNLTMPPDTNNQQTPLSPDLSLGLLPPQVKQATAAREKALSKMLNRVPFNVREDVTALVSMSVTLAESAQYNLHMTRQELQKLKIELRKKTTEIENLRKSCEIFRDKIRVTEDTVNSTKDALSVKQKFEIKNRRSVNRLAANNRMLIESLEALNVSTSSKQNKKGTQHSPEEGGESRPQSRPQSRPRSPFLVPMSNDEAASESSEELSKLEELNEKGASSDKLRTSLLRVAREHYKKVKFVELLENKLEEVRTNLLNSERLNRKLKSELDDLRSLYGGSQVLSTASLEKTDKEKKEKEEKKGDEVDRPKKSKKTADEKFKQVLAREGADYTEILFQYKRLATFFSSAPLSLTIDEIGQFLGSLDAIKIFDIEMIAVFVVDGPKRDKVLKYTPRSPHPESHNLTEGRSIAGDVIKLGRVTRLNNLHRVPSFRQEVDGTPCTITRKILSVPIRSVEDKSLIVGAIHLTNIAGAKGFTDVDEICASIFADFAASLIDMYRHRAVVLNSNDILSSLLDSSIQLYHVVPDSSSFASTKGLNIGEVIRHIEDISMSALKCIKCRVFLASERYGGNSGYMTYLEPSFGTSMKPGNQTSNSIYTGIAGYVLQNKEQFIFSMADDNSNAKLNPQVDLNPLDKPMVTIPVMDNQNSIICCIQLVLGPKSPSIAGSKEENMHFGLAAHWLSHQISTPLQFAIESLSAPMTRDLLLPLPSSPLSTPKSSSKKSLNSPKSPESNRKRSESNKATAAGVPAAAFEQLQTVHIQTQSDLEFCKSKMLELEGIVAILTESESELKEKLSHKTSTVQQLEAEIRRVMDSEATVKEALDETLNKQKKRRESHLLSDKHQNQLTADENDDELIEKRIHMVEVQYKDLVQSLEKQIHDLTAEVTKEHHNESNLLNEKKQVIEGLELEVTELKIQIQHLQTNNDKENDLAILEAKVQELQSQHAQSNNQNIEYQSTIESLTNDIKKCNEMIAQRDLIIESMNDTHDNDKADGDSAEITSLKDIITQKDAVIKILQDQISKLAQNMADANTDKKAKKAAASSSSVVLSSSSSTASVDWIEALDENGNKYWYNVSTGATSWDDPSLSPPGRVIGEWAENFDDQGNSYWVNTSTGQSSWEIPN